MEFFNVVKSRQSVRMYQDRSVEEEKLRTILETAASAPSAGNLQSYEIYVARRAGDRKALAQAALGQEFMAGAPIALVFCANPGRARPKYGQRGTELYALQDATIACTYAMTAATALGLASVWIGAFREDQVRRAIHVQEEVRPVAILAIGYAGEKPALTPRREFIDLIHEL
jgi:nitroreductase